MKNIALTATLAAALALPTFASAQEQSEGRALAGVLFSQLDETDRGFIDQGSFLNFGGDVFFSMDSDKSNALSLSEFLSWDFGMLNVAIEADREDSYYTAMRVVFAFWDRNGNGEVSRDEQRRSVNYDFARADLDNDGALTEEEFTSGFSVMVALRAAINPAPVE